MLARKYDNAAWELQPQREQIEHERQERQLQKQARKEAAVERLYQHMRQYTFWLSGAILAIYFASIALSALIVSESSALVALQRQENTLIKQTNELRIEVEQLKGPERIIGLAEQQLGLQVARSNIYVKAAEK